MRVIIAGGSGFIGRPLTAELAGAGHEVIVLSRDPTRRGGLPAGARTVRWDGRTAEGWGELADGAGAIVNLTGENLSSGPWSPARRRRFRASRTDPGTAIVQAVSQATVKPGVVVQSSGSGYYGDRGDAPVDESTPPGRDFVARLCLEWEAATAPVESLGVRRIVARTSPVLGPGSIILRRMRLPYKFFVGGPVAGGRQWFTWIDLADQVAALRFLLENEAASGAFNLGSPNPLTNAELARLMGKVLGRPAWFPTPGFLVRLVFGEMSVLVLTGQRIVPRRLTELGFTFRHAEPEASLREALR
ncbi:MAG: TIGR01777 family oxidoreductase [Chloroflexota bacterium]